MTPQNSEFSVEEFRERFLQLSPIQRLCVRMSVEGATQETIADLAGFTRQARVSETLKVAYDKLGMLRPGKSNDPVIEDRWNKQRAVLIKAIKPNKVTPEEELILDTVRQRKAQGKKGELTAAEYGEQPASAKIEAPAPPPPEPSKPEPDNPPAVSSPSTEPDPVNTEPLPSSQTEPSETEPDTNSTQSTPSSEPTQPDSETEPTPEPKQPEPTNQNEPPRPIVDVIRAKQEAGEVGQGRISVDRRLLLLLVGIAALFAFGGFLLARLTPDQPPPGVANLPPESTQTPIIITATPRPTLPFRPTRVRTATATRPTPTSQPTPTTNVATATPLPESTATPELQTPSPTEAPANTAISETPAPTEAPSPTEIVFDPTIATEFTDDFANGLRPEWKLPDAAQKDYVVAGADAKLAGAGPGVKLQLGTDKLADYTVSFKWGGNAFEVRVRPNVRYRDSYVAAWSSCGWERWDGANWVPLPNAGAITRCFATRGVVTIIAKGNVFQTLNGAEPYSRIVVPDAQTSGAFQIWLSSESTIDDFKLTVP